MGQSFFYLVFFQSSRNFEKFNSIGIWRSKDLLIPRKTRRKAILKWKRYMPNLFQEEIAKFVVFWVVHYYTTSFFEFYLILCKVHSNKIIKTTGRMKEALPMKGLTLKDSHCLVAILPVRPTHICTRVLLLQNEACMLQVHLRSRMVHNPENYLFPFITEFRQLDRNRWF